VVAVRFLLEEFLAGLDYFVDDVDVDFAKLFAEVGMDN
jgi:hypothetical protein